MKTPKRLRILALMHEDLVPPDSLEGYTEKEVDYFKTEYDVVTGLQHLGHEVVPLGLSDELAPLRKSLKEVKPHIVFGLMEEFRGLAGYDQHVISYLELMQTRYTGCNPRGLVLARDKALAKKVLLYHRIRAPRFMVIPQGRRVRRPKRLQFPLIVKSLLEEASAGISQASVVHNDDALAERVRFIHSNIKTAALVEQYIEGRELYVGLIGNHLLTVFPVWELFMDKLPPDAPRIATQKVKWDLEYQKKIGVRIGPATLSDERIQAIGQVCKRIYRALGLSGYARLDFRLAEETGLLYFLEANPNPDIARHEEFASAAKAAGLDYEPLLQKMVSLGLRWRPGG